MVRRSIYWTSSCSLENKNIISLKSRISRDDHRQITLPVAVFLRQQRVPLSGGRPLTVDHLVPVRCFVSSGRLAAECHPTDHLVPPLRVVIPDADDQRAGAQLLLSDVETEGFVVDRINRVLLRAGLARFQQFVVDEQADLHEWVWNKKNILFTLICLLLDWGKSVGITGYHVTFLVYSYRALENNHAASYNVSARQCNVHFRIWYINFYWQNFMRKINNARVVSYFNILQVQKKMGRVRASL